MTNQKKIEKYFNDIRFVLEDLNLEDSKIIINELSWKLNDLLDTIEEDIIDVIKETGGDN